MFRPLALLLALGTTVYGASVETALVIPAGQEAKLDAEAAFLARLLQKNGAVYFRLPAEALPSRDKKGQWRPEPLQAALRSQGALAFRGDLDAAAAGLDVSTQALQDEDEGRWLLATGYPRILVIEDGQSVNKMDGPLNTWRWPHRKLSFGEVEADARGILSASALDLVIVNSPTWWQNTVGPPSGPSGMAKSTAEALRDFVRQGGTAIFIDFAQWDLEKAWPKSLNLSPLGPYEVSRLNLEVGGGGGMSLAPVGVATDQLRSHGGFRLLGSDDFKFPDGRRRSIHAAYAMPDPGGGQGWVAGLAFHVFDQDESLAGKLRRLFLNLLLLSGDRRLLTQGEPKVPTPPVASPTRTPRRSPTPSPTASDLPTAGPSPTSSPTLLPTALPTMMPTPIPTRRPPAPPTLVATFRPTPLTARTAPKPPTAVPTPSLVPTRIPTRAVTVARPLPTPYPTPAPPQVTFGASRPTPWPTPRPALRPTLRPTAAPTRPPATLVPPTAVPTARVTVVLVESKKVSLGCLESAPEPFGDGGVYLKFCLGKAAKAQARVYDAQGRPLWQSELLSYGPGSQQIHFDGRSNGHPVVAGRYLWEIRVVHADGHVEQRQAAMSRRRESRRR